jgi:CopC domain
VDAESFTTLTPTIFAGQGFGFLPESMKLLPPFAITAQVGYAVQSSSTAFDEESGLLQTVNNPQVLAWGGTLQYSMPYLKSSVRDFGLPEFINRLSGKVMRLSVGTLAPGNYTVSWHVTSVDTHKTQGSFSFTVGK